MSECLRHRADAAHGHVPSVVKFDHALRGRIVSDDERLQPDECRLDFHGSDVGTEVRCSGRAEMDRRDAIHGEIAFHNGDETTFRVRHW